MIHLNKSQKPKGKNFIWEFKEPRFMDGAVLLRGSEEIGRQPFNPEDCTKKKEAKCSRHLHRMIELKSK